jgi:predicted transcriptional regulator
MNFKNKVNGFKSMNKISEAKEDHSENPKKSEDLEMEERKAIKKKLSEMHRDIEKVLEYSNKLYLEPVLERARRKYLYALLNHLFEDIETGLERIMFKKCTEKENCTSKFTAFLNHNFPEVLSLFRKQIKVMSSLNIYEDNAEQKPNISAIKSSEFISEILEPISNKQRLVILKAVAFEQKSFSDFSKLTGLTAGNLLFHLQKLMDSELILQQHDRGNYMITEKGFKILQSFNELYLSYKCSPQKIYHQNLYEESKNN